MLRCLVWFSVLILSLCGAARAADAPLRVLMLGDDGHHRPAELAKVITPVFATSGITVTYSADVRSLSPASLADCDCLLIYRDSGDLPVEAEAALLAFVEGGKGLVALHCASHAFRNSARYTALVGGRFKSHEGSEFRTRIVDAQHPALRGVKSFEAWDETYVHNELTSDRYVLMVRDHAGGAEPWTWVRQQGKGRVFYTASGHDNRSWRHQGFQALLRAGIQWAAGRVTDDLPPPEFVDAGDGLPNYLPGEKWGTEGERLRRMPKPLPPEQSMRHMHMPEGFQAKLFAAEPQVVKPMAMAFDERGRAWVIESVDYPNNLLKDPHTNGNDRIRILEDSDGDGRADKSTLFADKLNIPTGIVVVNGGALVAVSPYVLLLRDTNGDDVADERKIVLSGFGRGDTHAVHSNLRYGLDNWIWASVGYSGGRIQAGGQSHSFRQGLIRFRPDGSAFEVLTPTSNNTWGLGIGEDGDVIGSTANNQHSVHLAIPNRFFENVRGWYGVGSAGIEDHKNFHPVASDVRQMDWHGKFTAAAGHEIYTARSLPEVYWNRAAFVCEPTGRLIHTNLLARRGSGWVARDGYNLFASTDPWTAPIAAQVGPDGAVWVLDWYNFVVQHNPTPQGFRTGPGNAYVTNLRDKEHGRIYRLLYDSGRAASVPKLSAEDVDGLLAALGHENQFWRLTAQRLLVERGKVDVASRLAAIATDEEKPYAAVHAIWTLRGLATGQTPELAAAVGKALASRHAQVRRAALQAGPRDKSLAGQILEKRLIADKDPSVRLDALLALAETPGDDRAGAAIAALLNEPASAQDPWLGQAAVAAAAPSAGAFLQAAAKIKPMPAAPDALLAAVRAVSDHWARGTGDKQPSTLLAALADAEPALAAAALAGLAKGWPEKKPPAIDEATSAAMAKLLTRLTDGDRLQVVNLANRWGAGEKFAAMTAEIRKSLLDDLASDEAALDKRQAAAASLAQMSPDAGTIAAMLDVIAPRTAPELSAAVLEALGRTTSADAGKAIVERYARLTPALRVTAAAVLLRRPDWTTTLLDGVESGRVDDATLGIDVEQRLLRHSSSRIAERAKTILAKGGRTINADRQKVLDQLLPLAEKSGDMKAGKVVFEKNCGKCHKHGGTGGEVGPDLTGSAARKRGEILMDMIDPNRSVEGNFVQYTVTTGDGQVLTGLLAAETRTAVELLDAEAKRHVVLREDIEELTPSKLSLMPEGFEKLPPEEIVNLLAFLTVRGKYFSLPLEKAATVVTTRNVFFNSQSDIERMVFSDWGPKTAFDVPFTLIDPRGDRVPNAILLHGPQGDLPPRMPKSATIPCNGAAKSIHFLSGVSGWGYPASGKGSLTMIVRLHYTDGKSEDHKLLNGEHFADYIRRVDVPGSKFAFALGGRQLRYFAVNPARTEAIEKIELVKGDDTTAPLVMAVTVESP